MWTLDDDGNEVPDRPNNTAARVAAKRGAVLEVICAERGRPTLVAAVVHIAAANPALSVLRLVPSGHTPPVRLDRTEETSLTVQCRCGKAHHVDLARVRTLAKRAVKGRRERVDVESLGAVTSVS